MHKLNILTRRIDWQSQNTFWHFSNVTSKDCTYIWSSFSDIYVKHCFRELSSGIHVLWTTFLKLISKSFPILMVVCIWVHCTHVMFVDRTSRVFSICWPAWTNWGVILMPLINKRSFRGHSTEKSFDHLNIFFLKFIKIYLMFGW